MSRPSSAPLFAEWGIPTLAATGAAARIAGVQVVASGGIDNGLKAAKALAMGATVAGCARPVLQACLRDGVDGVRNYLSTMIAAIRMAMALTSSRTVSDLRNTHRVLGVELERWLSQLGSQEVSHD